MLRRPSRRIAAANRCPMATLGHTRVVGQVHAHHFRDKPVEYRYEVWPLEVQHLGGAGKPNAGGDAGGDGLGKQGVAVGGDPVLFFRLHDAELEGDVAQPGLVIFGEASTPRACCGHASWCS